MEIEIEKKTGLLKLGNYSLNPHLTFDELEASYPELKVNQAEPTHISFLQPRIYSLPIMEFEGYQFKGSIVFYSRYISGMYLERISDEPTLEEFFRENVNWVRLTQKWLKSELGLPNTVENGVYLEEPDVLSSKELSVLKSWKYKFKWGEFGFAYHWEQTGLYMNPDHHYQIPDWDAMRKYCQYLGKLAAHQNPESAKNLAVVLSLIDIIRQHFDYIDVRPQCSLGFRGIGFDLKKWETSVSVEIFPEQTERQYYIQRTDTLYKAYANDDTLVDTLRKFFETERL